MSVEYNSNAPADYHPPKFEQQEVMPNPFAFSPAEETAKVTVGEVKTVQLLEMMLHLTYATEILCHEAADEMPQVEGRRGA